MKKITLFLAAFFAVVLCANAQNLNNPKGADGYYIVKWDCEKGTWAASNDFEVDQTFTFAIDVTGTPYEDWLKETPIAAGATRSLAVNKWTGFGNVHGDSHRLKQIKGNIYGATWNFVQLAAGMNVADATTPGAETVVFGQVFGFEYTADSPGAGWWLWPTQIPVGTNIDPGVEGGAMFKTLPYTGTKTGIEFYNDDYGNELFGITYALKGYAPACAVDENAIEEKQLNNPKDANGFFIVKWDCNKNTWAASNDFEVDETFTFAIDVTGTPYEAWLHATPTTAGATRSLAINRWTGFGDVNGDSNRLKQIRGNIYGATWNIAQLALAGFNMADATAAGAETFVNGQIFGYEYTDSNPTAGWWLWPEGIAEGTAIDPGTGGIFKTLPYTGTKTSSEFNNKDFDGLFGIAAKGYAPACAIATPIDEALNNPKDADGFFIVKWDCANNTWAESNDFEVDETFTFAIDVTGTPYETWLKETPTTEGATRSFAINRWTGFGDVDGSTNRLMQIRGNIYGATWNLAQLATPAMFEKATAIGAETFVNGQVFGFEYTSSNPEAGWWMWPEKIPVGTNTDPGTGSIFKTKAYTGTKTSPEFNNKNFDGLFGNDAKGYAPACAISTGIDQVKLDAADVVGTEFYSLQGIKLNAAPQGGLFIKISILSDGTRVGEKLFNVQK